MRKKKRQDTPKVEKPSRLTTRNDTLIIQCINIFQNL